MLHQRMFETGSYKSLLEHIALYKALEAYPSHPPPDLDQSKRRRHDAGASGSSKPQAPQSLAWKKFDTRDAPSSSSKQQSDPHAEQPVDEIPIQDSDNISDSEDTDSAHLPKTNQRLEWLKPIPDDERPATPEPAWVIPTSHVPDAMNNWDNAGGGGGGDMRTFMNWYCQKMGKTELTQADLEGQAYEVVKPFYPDVVHLQFQMEECHKMLTDQIDWANPEGDQVRIDISKPLPLSGPPGHVTIQTQFFFNKDLDYLRYGSKGSGQALSISKMKVARYHDFGLELLVPEHIYDYLKEITLRRVAHQEYTIAKKDFKNFGLKTSNSALRATGWDATGFEFKHDYTIIDSPRAVVFPVSNNEWKIMRFNEIYKFIHAIERRLKTRRILRNLECFVGGRVADIDYSLLQRTE
ncbi:hypothetical protein Tco_0706402 [Tanacetum coccineum]|uniref:Uncharacterized protein n=1 Tax=Tanacetum coccineum TaxID=301880 RepID=A0ABQ4Y8X6_9ASTR